MAKSLAVSPYKLTGFQECPRWYYFEYLDEAIAPYKKELKKPRSFFTVGDCVHKTINKFLTIPQPNRNEEIMSKLLADIWSPYSGIEGGFESQKDEARCFEEAQEMLKNFWARQQALSDPFYSPGSDPSKELKKSEIGPDLILQGKIDRIDKDGEDLHVIDYKTGKSEEGSAFQILAYGLLSEAVFQLSVSKVSFWYLRSNHMQTFQFGETEREEALTKINEIVGNIRNETEFAAVIGSRCFICDYVKFCPEKEKVMGMFSHDNKSEETETKDIGSLPF